MKAFFPASFLVSLTLKVGYLLLIHRGIESQAGYWAASGGSLLCRMCIRELPGGQHLWEGGRPQKPDGWRAKLSF